jgi:ATP-binding cassette subfamily C protein
VHRVDPAALVGSRVLIPQEAYVFTGSLRDNLTYLRPDADPADLAAAVDALGLAPLVRRLGGYDAPVDPGALAAGERQLIALARAYLAPAPIVLLDEATAELDPAAEARAERAFAGRPGTLVVIAHRLTSARRARRILVLDGTHAQLGTHEQLVAGSPLYRDLLGHWRAPVLA